MGRRGRIWTWVGGLVPATSVVFLVGTWLLARSTAETQAAVIAMATILTGIATALAAWFARSAAEQSSAAARASRLAFGMHEQRDVAVLLVADDDATSKWIFIVSGTGQDIEFTWQLDGRLSTQRIPSATRPVIIETPLPNTVTSENAASRFGEVHCEWAGGYGVRWSRRWLPAQRAAQAHPEMSFPPSMKNRYSDYREMVLLEGGALQASPLG